MVTLPIHFFNEELDEFFYSFSIRIAIFPTGKDVWVKIVEHIEEYHRELFRALETGKVELVSYVDNTGDIFEVFGEKIPKMRIPDDKHRSPLNIYLKIKPIAQTDEQQQGEF